MVEKASIAPTVIGSLADDFQNVRDSGKSKGFVLNRRLRCVILATLITIISLTIGLGFGMKSRSKSSSKTENVSKLSWPELVGIDAEDASAWMKENYPMYNVYVVNYGEYVTADFDVNRVRIYKAPNGTVYKVPKIGR